MLFRKIIAVYFDNPAKNINTFTYTLWGKTKITNNYQSALRG